MIVNQHKHGNVDASFPGNYSARLSNNQDSYPAVYTNFGINMPAGSPKGLFRHYWDGITVRYEKEG